MAGYPTIESANFGQEIECRQRPESRSGTATSGCWTRTPARRSAPGDRAGLWRPSEDGREIELLLAHPTGIVEMYYGTIEPARVTLRTDSVVRSPLAKEYNAGSRLYGLVESQLFWVMDMAAVGQELQSQFLAQLKRVD